MGISFRLVFVPAVVLLIFLSFDATLNLSFEKSTVKNSFVNKDVIPICCAWGPEIQDGVLTYSILGQSGTGGGDKKIDNAVASAVNYWNKNLNGIQIVKSPVSNNADVFISFINDGKKVAGKTVNSIDSNGFIRKSYITLSKEFFNRPFSSGQLEQVAEHEFGHVLGLNHANFNGNLMSAQVNDGSKTISSCVIEAVNIANSWKIQDGGVSLHGPTKSFVTC
ncbi:MAG: matrixin family metalloprotease [Candidatus Nitrosocosmicus sp.]